MPTTPSSTKAKPKKSPKKKELSSAQKPAAPSSPAAVVAVNGPGELVRTSLPDGAECSLLSGGSLVEHDCSFSTDNKYLLCCSGNVVKVFSCKTGAQVRMLEGHTDQVTAVAHNPANILQACSASLDGCIMLWDIDGALMLRCFCLGLPIAAMAIDSTMPTDAFVLTADLPPSPTTPAYARGLAVPGRAYSVQLALDKVTLALTLTLTLTIALAPAPTLTLTLTLTLTIALAPAPTLTLTLIPKGLGQGGPGEGRQGGRRAAVRRLRGRRGGCRGRRRRGRGWADARQLGAAVACQGQVALQGEGRRRALRLRVRHDLARARRRGGHAANP